MEQLMAFILSNGSKIVAREDQVAIFNPFHEHTGQFYDLKTNKIRINELHIAAVRNAEDAEKAHYETHGY